ncbi:hypothetical protein KO561_03100 [Radiobacillus kanasensis]|uniref:hypothetical protein n=1 Tax=Radiobacillus kanasensis TaxID=2844358 RepID=UPI001E2F19FD|nr:hypothetical protein [Radiobacillus kanasensis]UFT99964.1 hypothetical protein KO561_03100 [Radiobacillus kanasensis]
MERIFNIIKAQDFNFALTNLLIDLHSSNYQKYFEELWFDENNIGKLSKEELDKLTKLAAVIEYVGNRQPGAKLYDWIYLEKLRLEAPYTPGLEGDGFQRVKRIFSAPREFSIRNVFFEEETLKPI